MAANSKQETKVAKPVPEATAQPVAEVTAGTVQDIVFPPNASER